MISKKHRLPAYEIRRVRSNGKRADTPPLRLYCAITQDEVSRFAIQIPKKIVPSAVDRNRWKRIISESLNSLLPTFSPIDCLIVLTQEMPGFKTQDIGPILEQSLTKKLSS